MQHAAPSQRQLRVGEQVRHLIAETLARGHFRSEELFRMAQNVTVSEVRVSPDLKSATAYVSTLGGSSTGEILPALNEEAQVFQKEIAHKLKLRFTPRIRFVEDESFEKANRIESILHDLKKEKMQ
ncbi:MAG: 30S ribosome-binding factor RbfA [Proteobacteria bacterium]|nr:30S ribosome-binding factor RbfA [Pseudomonadota bacterium]